MKYVHVHWEEHYRVNDRGSLVLTYVGSQLRWATAVRSDKKALGSFLPEVCVAIKKLPGDSGYLWRVTHRAYACQNYAETKEEALGCVDHTIYGLIAHHKLIQEYRKEKAVVRKAFRALQILLGEVPVRVAGSGKWVAPKNVRYRKYKKAIDALLAQLNVKK